MNTNDNHSKPNRKPQMTPKRRKRKTKLLIRRILIVMALLLILLAIVQIIGFIIGLMFNKDHKNDPEKEFEPDSGYIVTSEGLTEALSTEDISLENNTTDTTSADLTSPGATTTESTQEESGNQATTTSENLEGNSTGEAIQMNFKEVSYYLERFNTRYLEYAKQNSTLTSEEIVRDVNMNLDNSFYENIGTAPDLNSVQILCNKYFALPADFTPNKLVDVPENYYVNDGKEYRLNEEALNAFIKMSDAAKQEGLSLKIISAYRSNSYQERLYEKYKAKSSQAEADRYSARPGHSEHETGYGIDINDVSQAFEKTDEFEWLQENAHLYGYILRYPKGLDYLTGYMYEPWHYRYLGTDLATKVHQSGLTYDAYYAMYLLK